MILFIIVARSVVCDAVISSILYPTCLYKQVSAFSRLPRCYTIILCPVYAFASVVLFTALSRFARNDTFFVNAGVIASRVFGVAIS